MRIKVVVHVVVDVEYDVDDESKSFADVARENVPRAVAHLCSVLEAGQKQGAGIGVRFGVASRDRPTVTCIMLNPQEVLS